VGRISKGLKAMAKKLEIPLLELIKTETAPRGMLP
jgi:hypothetical protein